MKVAVIRYNAGNIQSVLFALERIGIQGIATDDPKIIQSADKVIFPGVGEASTAMEYLKARGLDKLIISLKQPVLGICLGMQLLCKFSEENNTPCLGVFNTRVKRLPPLLKIPHVGWNLANNRYYYFVHSYYAELCDQTSAVTDYGLSFSSMLRKDNFLGTQFHPEKSGDDGETILKNFLDQL